VIESRGSRSLTEFTEDVDEQDSVNIARLLSGTVPQVKEELEEVDKARYKDILEREKQGENRTSVTEHLKREIREIPEASERDVRAWVSEYIRWVIQYPDSIETSVDREEIVGFVYSSHREEYAYLKKEFVEQQLDDLIDEGVFFEKEDCVYLSEEENRGDV